MPTNLWLQWSGSEGEMLLLLGPLVGVLAGCAVEPPAETDVHVEVEPEDSEVVPVESDTPAAFTLRGTLTTDFGLDVPPGPVAIVLVPIDLADEPFEVEAPWAITHVTGVIPGGAPVSFALELPAEVPDESLFGSYFNEYAGFEVAAFVVGAFADADGNGVRGADERIIAARFKELICFTRGDIPAEIDGAAEGWNLVPLALDEDPTTFVPIPDGWDGLDLHTNLLPSERTSLSGHVTAEIPSGSTVGLIPEVASEPDPPPNVTLVSMPLGTDGSFTVVLPEHPPTTHYEDTEEIGARVAFYDAQAWFDSDSDGLLDLAHETPFASSEYVDDPPRYVSYLEATDYGAGLYVDVFGLGAGWQIVQVGDDGYVVADWDSGVVATPP